MSTLYFQLALYTLSAAVGLAVVLWAATVDHLPDGEGF